MDRAVRRVEPGLQADVLADQPLQHRLHLPEQLVEADHPRLERLLAAEGEELACQGRRALLRLADRLQVDAPLVPPVQPLVEQLALEGDRRQQVVERVGDAAGQTADRLHALCMAQPLLAGAQGLLHRLGLRDVAQRPAQPVFPGGPAVGVADHRQHGRERLAGARLDFDLELAGDLAGARLRDQVAEAAAVLRRQVEEEGLARQVLLADAEQRGRRPVRLFDDPFEVGHQVPEGGLVEEPEVAVPLVLQRLAGGLELVVLRLQLLVGHLQLREPALQHLQLRREALGVGKGGGLALQSAELLLRPGERRPFQQGHWRSSLGGGAGGG